MIDKIVLIVLQRPLEHTENAINTYIAKERYIVLWRKVTCYSEPHVRQESVDCQDMECDPSIEEAYLELAYGNCWSFDRAC